MTTTLPVERWPLGKLIEQEDGLEWGLTVVPHHEGKRTFHRLCVRGQIGRGSERRQELAFDGEVSREQAQASLASLARALGMGAMLMGSLDEVLAEKKRELGEIDKQIAALQGQAKLLRVEERELQRACERIARARGGVAALAARSPGNTQAQVLDVLRGEPLKEFRAADFEVLGRTPGAINAALIALTAKGEVKRVGRGLFALANKAKKK